MSNGRRRPSSRGPNCAPRFGLIKEGRVAKQRTRAAQIALVVVSMLVCAAIVHGPGPPFTYRIGQRPDRRASGQRQGIPDPQPDQDQQRAAGRRRSGAAVARSTIPARSRSWPSGSTT